MACVWDYIRREGGAHDVGRRRWGLHTRTGIAPSHTLMNVDVIIAMCQVKTRYQTPRMTSLLIGQLELYKIANSNIFIKI